jgi:hypothetical protein
MRCAIWRYANRRKKAYLGTRFGRQVKPDVSINMATGEISLSLGKGVGFDPTPIAPGVFALPANVSRSDLAIVIAGLANQVEAANQ